MAKFKRSFQPGGFRPEQAGDGGEARLREYSKQVIKGLQQERDAVISDRNRTADVMKQNFQIESQQDKANAKIEQANIQRVIDEQQGISQRALQEFQTQTEASKKIYDAFSSLSTTASKKFAELEVQALEEKGRQEKAEIIRLGYNHPLVKGIAKLRKQMSIEQMQGTTELNVAYARGEINELEYTELMKQLNSLTADGKAAILNQLGKEFASFYTQKLNTDEGRAAAGDQQATLEFGQRALAEWEQINSITGINAALKQDSGYYDQIFSVLQSASTKAGQIQTQNNKTQWVSKWQHTLDNTNTDAAKTTFIEENWSTLVAYLGAEKAHATLRDAFARVDPVNGRLLLDTSVLTNSRLGLTKGKDGNFKTYGDFWPGRVIDIQNLVTDARDKINQRRDTATTNKNREVAKQFIAELDPTLSPEKRLQKLKDYEAVVSAKGQAVPKGFTGFNITPDMQARIDQAVAAAQNNNTVPPADTTPAVTTSISPDDNPNSSGKSITKVLPSSSMVIVKSVPLIPTKLVGVSIFIFFFEILFTLPERNLAVPKVNLRPSSDLLGSGLNTYFVTLSCECSVNQTWLSSRKVIPILPLSVSAVSSCWISTSNSAS